MYVGTGIPEQHKDVLITPPPAVVHLPRNPGDLGRQTAEVSDRERIHTLERELKLASYEVREQRNITRCFAAMLEMLVLMNRRGEQPRTIDQDGTLLIPRLPDHVMRARGGTVTVANHPEGFLVRFRDRLQDPTQEAV
jgi:hypothetical protein